MHFKVQKAKSKSKDTLPYEVVAEDGELTATAKTKIDADLISNTLMRNRLAKKNGLSALEMVAFDVIHAMSQFSKPGKKKK